MTNYYVSDSRMSDVVAEVESLGPWPDGLNIDWIDRTTWIFKVDAECPDQVAEIVSAASTPLEGAR